MSLVRVWGKGCFIPPTILEESREKFWGHKNKTGLVGSSVAGEDPVWRRTRMSIHSAVIPLTLVK